MQKKRILITGGAGFIGSHLADELIKNHSVIVLDDLSVGEEINLKDFILHGGQLIVGDIRNGKVVAKAMEKIDFVFHLAVQCVRLSFKNPYIVHDVNTKGTLTVLEAARKFNIKRFVYISSSEVYGEIKKVPISESDPLFPATIYGASKLAGEYYSLAYMRSYSLPVTIIRPFNTYGPRSHFEGVYGEVIPKFFIRVINNNKPLIYGDGKQTRDFTYISDTVKGIYSAGFSNSTIGKIINIGTGKETQIGQLAKLISRVCNKNIPSEYRPKRPADIRKLCADISSAKKILNFSPRVSLDRGLSKYSQWLLTTGFDFKKALLQEKENNWI